MLYEFSQKLIIKNIWKISNQFIRNTVKKKIIN